MSTDPSVTTFSPLWTVKISSCAPSYQPQNNDYGQFRSLAITADGKTLVVSFVVDNVESLRGYSMSTGEQLFVTPTAGGSYGVYLSGDSQWALVAEDNGNGGRNANVYSTHNGTQRGVTGCRMGWNAPPAITDDGSLIVTADQNGMWVCAWDESAQSYDPAVNVDIPSKGQTYWFPFDSAFLTVGGHHFAGFTYAGGDYSEIGRFCAFFF